MKLLVRLAIRNIESGKDYETFLLTLLPGAVFGTINILSRMKHGDKRGHLS